MVTNVPPSLNWKDLKGAFSAAGTIEFCEVSANGKAEITFQTAQAARQAVDTYNGGDLNGRSIKVTCAPQTCKIENSYTFETPHLKTFAFDTPSHFEIAID